MICGTGDKVTLLVNNGAVAFFWCVLGVFEMAYAVSVGWLHEIGGGF
jgi:hypothetical protein